MLGKRAAGLGNLRVRSPRSRQLRKPVEPVRFPAQNSAIKRKHGNPATGSRNSCSFNYIALPYGKESPVPHDDRMQSAVCSQQVSSDVLRRYVVFGAILFLHSGKETVCATCDFSTPPKGNSAATSASGRHHQQRVVPFLSIFLFFLRGGNGFPKRKRCVCGLRA